MRILVTGANGLLGQKVTALLDNDAGVDNRHAPECTIRLLT